MTQEQIFKNAKWIENTGSDAPLFRKTFYAQKGEKAEITICGLGFFKLFVNGKKVSDDLLVPNASNYSQRDTNRLFFPINDEMGYRIYCMKYDISVLLCGGKNTLAVMLGNGYYNQNKRNAEGCVVYGTPKLCYIIEKVGETVVSDETTLTHNGFITENNLYLGEKQDYSLYPTGWLLSEFDEKEFKKSKEIPAPKSEFFIQTAPSDKVIKSIKPKLIGKIDDMDLYDVGENTVGYAVFEGGKKGNKIVAAYAEEIHDNRPYYGMKFQNGYQTDEFVCDGENREYIPHFTWHGFRYFKVSGAEPVRVDVVHSDCPVTSSFECDNKVLNWLYDAFVRTQLCNMHSGVPSDCPHRERLGYTGDGQLCCEAAMMMLDCKEFYRKWLYDIADCQCRLTGHVQHTAPLMGGGGGPSGWGGAIVEVPIKFYKAYGDKDLLNEFFPKMLRFLDYLESRSDNGLVWREEKDGWCLGDWCAPEQIKIPETFVNTCLYVAFMNQTLEAAEILGRQSEAKHLEERIEKSKKALHVAYCSPASHNYCGDVQGANSLAFKAGLGDEKTAKNTVKKYSELGMFDTGIFATEALIAYLFEIGNPQLAFELLSNRKEVSFDFMARNGATTIWENWSGKDSRNHPMFGAVTKYLFMYLLGIRQPKDGAGYEKVIVSPCFVPCVDSAKGHITTQNGVVGVEFKKNNEKAEIKVCADPKIKAVFEFDGQKIPFSGEKIFIIDLNSRGVETV